VRVFHRGPYVASAHLATASIPSAGRLG
jgi:hypothetical protein